MLPSGRSVRMHLLAWPRAAQVRLAHATPLQAEPDLAMLLLEKGAKTSCMQKKTIPEAALSKITLMILKGLFYLHKQMHVVHRDIKPANILLSLDGSAKVADFGIARNLDNTHALCETHMGTEFYMAPERLQTEKGYGFASDVWSVGVTLVECATGQYPFNTKGGVLTFAMNVCPPLSPLCQCPSAGVPASMSRSAAAMCATTKTQQFCTAGPV